MPLEVRDFRAREEDVLTGPDGGLFLLDLKFHDLGRVLDDLRDVSPMAGSNFAKDPLRDPNHTTDEPIALQDRSIKTHPQEQERNKETPTQNTPMVLKEQ